ncbi:acyltransferase family protein [Phocaeicola plebeius]|uniref:acyltransferase family protein n=1 Tax=Phocaeicola plebeius TaxID=310297 RepID=UPI003F95294D
MSTKKTIYKQLTETRYILFAVACIWIFFRHTFYYNQYSYGVIDPIIQIGDCGVDIFMFLSGYGLFFSYNNNPNPFIFYKKRVWRIIPTVMILLIAFAITESIFRDSTTKYFNLSYWFYQIYSNYWYIGAILLFYAIFPIIYASAIRQTALTLFLSLIISLGGIILLDMGNNAAFKQLIVYFARLPIFVIGCIMGYKSKWLEKSWIFLSLLLLGIPLLYIFPKEYQRLCYCITTVGFILIISKISYMLPRSTAKIFNILGKASLEFYLIHIFMLSNNVLSIINKIIPSQIIASFTCLILASILAILTHLFISTILKRCIA